jgi:soluble lytic murein transglycosylase
MKNFKIITINLAVIFFSCFANVKEDSNISKIGFYGSPDEIIQKLGNENAGFKEHFLLGVSFKKNGELKKAIYHFANSCFKYSKNTSLKIYPYTVYKYINGFHIKSDYYYNAVYEIAALFFEYREFEYVIKFVDRLSKSDTALYRDAAILKANAMMELQMFDDAISFLKELVLQYEDVNSKSLIHIRLASVYEQKEDLVNAIVEYFNVLRLDTKTWQSGIACDRILGNTPKVKYEFKNNEELLLAVSLYHNAKYSSSIDILKKLLNAEMNEQSKREALDYVVKSYVRTNKLNDAETLISHYITDISLYYNLLKIEADELWALKKRQLAFNIYQKIYANTTDELLRESHKRIVQHLISRNSDYEKILIGYKDKYPKDKTSEYFIWELARNKIKGNDNKSAIKYLEECLSLFPKGAYSGKCRFWLVKLYGTERKDDALKKIKEMVLINPDSAYTWKILDTLRDKYKPEELKSIFMEAVKLNNSEEAIFAHTLLFIHEKDFAERNKRIAAMDFIDILKNYRTFEDDFKSPELDSELEDILKEIEKYFIIGYTEGINRELGLIPGSREYKMDKYKILAYLGAKYNNYYFSAASILKLLKFYNLKENIAILSDNITAKLFPAAFSELVEAACAEQNIQKEMIYAVMKAESTFNHKAVSSAGAVGLMQLMPATAKDIARGMKIKNFDLKETTTSIYFGVKYLAWLNKFFKGDFATMMAGYNAGAGNVKKWMKEFNGDDDYLIEFIPFEETRTYILRTGKFFIQYRIVCGSSNLNR